MSKNVSQALLDIYVAPHKVFNVLPEKKGWSWIAFLIMLAVSVLGLWYFYAGMSPEWIAEQQIAQVAHTMSPAEIEQSRAVMAQMADKTGIISVAAVLVMTPIMLAIMALYLMLVGNPSQKRRYSQWYAMTVWCNMPSVVNMLGLIALVLISSDPNIPLATVTYLSLNQLLLGLEPSHAWYTWAEACNLIYFWISGLFAVGLHSWTKYSAVKSSVLGFLPLVIIYGLWAVFI